MLNDKEEDSYEDIINLIDESIQNTNTTVANAIKTMLLVNKKILEEQRKFFVNGQK